MTLLSVYESVPLCVECGEATFIELVDGQFKLEDVTVVAGKEDDEAEGADGR